MEKFTWNDANDTNVLKIIKNAHNLEKWKE